MKENQLLLSKSTLYVLLIVGFIITIAGALFKILHLGGAQIALGIGSLLSFATWLIVLIDMAKNKLRNKVFWVISLFLFGNLTILIYLIKREKLIYGA